MSRTLPTDFSTAITLDTQKPCVIMDFGSTRRYCSGPFKNQNTTNDKEWIASFEADLLNIDVRKAQTRQGLFKAVINNNDLDVSENIISDINILSRDVDFSVGFQTIDDDQFVDLGPQRVSKINHPNVNQLEVVTADTRRLISDKDLFFNFAFRTQLNGALTAGGTTATVDSTSGFLADLETNIPEADLFNQAIVVGGTEIMEATIATGTTFTVGRSKAINGNVGIAHEDNEEVLPAVIFSTNGNAGTAEHGPIKPIISLLMTRKSTGGSATHGYYDMVNHESTWAGLGLGLTTSQINLDSFESMDYMLRNWFQDKSNNELGRMGVAWKPEPARTWLENYLSGLGVFLYIDSDGLLAIKSWDRIELHFNETVSNTISNADVREPAKMEIDYDNGLLNVINIEYEKNWLNGSYSQSRTWEHVDSTDQHGETEQKFLIQTDVIPDQISDNELALILFRFFATHADPICLISLSTWIDKIGIAPGDVIEITANRFIDYTSGTPAQGVSDMKMLVTGQSLQWLGGKPQITLKGFTWDNRNTSGTASNITETERLAAAWDDADIALDRTVSVSNATTEARDAYIDLSPNDSGQVFRLELKITPPASPTNADTEYVFDLSFHLQDPADTDQYSWDFRNIRYNTDDAAFNRVFYFIADSGNVSYARVNVEVYDFRALDSTLGASGDECSLTVIALKAYDISAVTINEIT